MCKHYKRYLTKKARFIKLGLSKAKFLLYRKRTLGQKELVASIPLQITAEQQEHKVFIVQVGEIILFLGYMICILTLLRYPCYVHSDFGSGRNDDGGHTHSRLRTLLTLLRR